MSGMNEFLAQAYGTAQPQQTADAEKVAQAELFAKMAAENGIDLNALNDNQITELWNATFAKTAGEEKQAAEHGHKHKHHGEKKAEAEALAQWTQTKEAQAKFAEADFFGRQMAHAYVAELRKIASEGGFNFLEGQKEAAMPPALAAALAKKDGGEKKEEPKKDEKKDEKKEEKKEASIKASPTSALTQVSAALAVEKAAAAGFDRDEASKRIAAVLTLGFNEANTKVAAAAEFPQAKEIRALELLETADPSQRALHSLQFGDGRFRCAM